MKSYSKYTFLLLSLFSILIIGNCSLGGNGNSNILVSDSAATDKETVNTATDSKEALFDSLRIIEREAVIKAINIDADNNGRVDAIENVEYSPNINWFDSTYLTEHPDLKALFHRRQIQNDSISSLKKYSLDVPQTLYNLDLFNDFSLEDIIYTATDSLGKIANEDVTIIGDYNFEQYGIFLVTVQYKEIQKDVTVLCFQYFSPVRKWLSVEEPEYSIRTGEVFNPREDISFIAKTEYGAPANDSVTITGYYNTDSSGIYTITLTYGELLREVKLKVFNYNYWYEFMTLMTHESKINDTLVVINAGETFTYPTIQALTREDGDADIRISTTDGLNDNDVAKIGTYRLAWILTDAEDIEINAVYRITLEVIESD